MSIGSFLKKIKGTVDASNREIRTSKAPEAVGPYSQGILREVPGGGGRWAHLYLSGQIGLDPETGKAVSNDSAEQMERIMKNHRAILEEADASLDDVVKTTIYLVDLSDYDRVNDVYEKYFSRPYPARSCVEVCSLPKGARVEMELTAMKT